MLVAGVPRAAQLYVRNEGLLLLVLWGTAAHFNTSKSCQPQSDVHQPPVGHNISPRAGQSLLQAV
jgi:hypothetical protein